MNEKFVTRSNVYLTVHMLDFVYIYGWELKFNSRWREKVADLFLHTRKRFYLLLWLFQVLTKTCRSFYLCNQVRHNGSLNYVENIQFFDLIFST